MRTEPLNLDHQSLLRPKLKALGLDISEYAFANLYLFRHVHQTEVLFNKDIYIKGKTRDGFTFLMPISPIDSLEPSDWKEALGICDFLFPIPEQWRNHFPNPPYRLESRDEDTDYLVNVERMRTYAGRHLDGRRNLVRQFNDHFPQHHTVPLTIENADDGMKVLTEWQKPALEDARFTDFGPCMEALELIDQLNLTGRITYVDHQPIGFVIGEPLNDQVFVIHFAKGLTSYKGVYQFIYQELAISLANNFQFINLEQDMGSEKLRKSKQEYFPEKLVSKLRIYGK
jgi:hypothetical protein